MYVYMYIPIKHGALCAFFVWQCGNTYEEYIHSHSLGVKLDGVRCF